MNNNIEASNSSSETRTTSTSSILISDIKKENILSTAASTSTPASSNKDDLFQLAAKAEKLLKEILQSNKSNNSITHAAIKQEPIVNYQQPLQFNQPPPRPSIQFNSQHHHLQQHQHLNIIPHQQNPYYNNNNHQQANLLLPIVPPHQQSTAQYQNNSFQTIQNPNGTYSHIVPTSPAYLYAHQQQPQQNVYFDPSFYAKTPPPFTPQQQVAPPPPPPQTFFFAPPQTPIVQSPLPLHLPPHHHQLSQNVYTSTPVSYQNSNNINNIYHQSTSIHSNLIRPSFNNPYLNMNKNAYNQMYANNENNIYRKRKFGEINNNNNNSNQNMNVYNLSKRQAFQAPSSSLPSSTPASTTNVSSSSSLHKCSDLGAENNAQFDDKNSNNDNDATSTNNSLNTTGSIMSSASITIKNNLNNEEEEEDLNIMRERELKDLKCKSIVEKMSVFLKYYQQFKDAYIERVQSLECSDSLKLQFNSLIKYLNEYEILLNELDQMITEHERSHCKNNHRKTKKFFNKTKAFIRYECNKRLQTNIFEYRRLINSQDRYAGMFDLLDMNSYLISLIPDIGVSMRRYINRCEKAKLEELEEMEEDDYQSVLSENSNDSFANELNNNNNNEDENNNQENSTATSKQLSESVSALVSNDKKDNLESFSQKIDTLNRYLLDRVQKEESLDELVQERIFKWINKRQSKYILIFSEVDKLLNQHKAGECYSKFHSYLLFNLGKLVTVCDSYHQKLKELLYSTTIRRKKKRKKVKLLPEAMSDVFNQILDLKKILEHTKLQIKKCNEFKSQQNISNNSNVNSNNNTNMISNGTNEIAGN